jgi:hypothetical protein
MRRQSYVWGAVLAAVLVGGAVLVGFVWVRGEVHNTVLRTAASPAPSLPLAPPASALSTAWRTADTAATGSPVWHGTVVTYAQHVVRGRDARTGRITWSYLRSNRSVCTAAQANGVTVAIFRVNGNCDEVTGLDSATGARRWTRTLDMDGHPVNGTPVVTATPYTVLVRTPRVMYALAPDSGYDRWEFHPNACTIQDAVVGDAGALISQTCHSPDCSQVADKLCGNGVQLLLRDAYCGYQDTSKSCRDSDSNNPNPDQIIWNKIGDSDVPVSASNVVSALNRTTRALDLLGNTDGHDVTTTALVPAPATATDVQAVLTNDGVVVNTTGAAHLVRATGDVAWTSADTGPVTVTPSEETQWPAPLGGSRVTVPSTDSVVTVDGRTGAELSRSTLPAPLPAGASAIPLGSGFLVVASNGCTAYT